MQFAERKTVLYPRFAAERLREILADSPVALIHGPRQCGKTTLARIVGDSLGYAYFSFDDEAARAAAREDPFGFADGLPERTTLDEVQFVPELFGAIKRVVDRERIPGRFILTGSSNVLLLPRLSESLAGRMGLLRLHPLAECEIERKRSQFLDRLFQGSFRTGTFKRLGPELAGRIARGGFPPAVIRKEGHRRLDWYLDFVETLVQRDARDISRIRSLDVLPRMLAFAAAQTARLLNVSEMSASLRISRPTAAQYLTLLQRLFLLEALPPWYSNRLSRLVKTPKLHVADSGLACALLGADELALNQQRKLLGQLLETFVFCELRRQASWQRYRVDFFHYRDRDGREVDLVLERGNDIAAVEVKASATVTPADFKAMRRLKQVAGKRFRAGVVLYDGEICAGFGGGMLAVPVRLLWEG